MGNRISFDEISKQLRSIYGVMLCYIQDEIQNDAPYLVRYGQFESVIGNLCKKTTNSFIRLKSLHRTQDVILHHCQGETCDLGGKMYGLALAQVQQGLTVLVCDFGSPTSGVYTICLKTGLSLGTVVLLDIFLINWRFMAYNNLRHLTLPSFIKR